MKILEELWYGNVAPCERGEEKGIRLLRLGRLIQQNEAAATSGAKVKNKQRPESSTPHPRTDPS